jgi:hypothetical protein
VLEDEADGLTLHDLEPLLRNCEKQQAGRLAGGSSISISEKTGIWMGRGTGSADLSLGLGCRLGKRGSTELPPIVDGFFRRFLAGVLIGQGDGF